MLASIKQRLDREDEGFTLIELMVVVLIIAILLAIAIPTFLGARNSANARSAQSNLRNALTAEQTEWTNSQSFSSDSPTMTGIEQALNWVTIAPAAAHDVSVAVGDADSNGNNQVTELEAYGKDGNCYYILQSNDPVNSFTGYAATKQSATHTCTAPAAADFGTIAVGAPALVAKSQGSVGPQAAGAPASWYTSF